MIFFQKKKKSNVAQMHNNLTVLWFEVVQVYLHFFVVVIDECTEHSLFLFDVDIAVRYF